MTLSIPIPITVPLRMDAEEVIRVGNTRVTLQSVIADFHRGASPEEIVHHYSTLDLGDVYVVIGYYLQHRAVVDAYIAQQQAEAEAIRAEMERHYPTDALRAKILAYRDAQRDE